MDIIKKLRNYFFGLLLISVGLTAWVIILEAINLKIIYVDDSLIHTIIASLYAVTIALGIYWKQQKDKYESLKTSLQKYLEYITDNFPSKNLPKFQEQILQLDKKKPNVFMIEVKEVKIEILEDNLINALINSGYFYNILYNLLEFQKGIKIYKEFKYKLSLEQYNIDLIIKGLTQGDKTKEKEYDKVVESLNDGIKMYTANINAIREAI